MHILFVCRFLPHPEIRDSGGQDTYHYIAELSTRHDISLIAFVSPHQEADVLAMQKFCVEVVAVPYAATRFTSRLWRAWWRLVYPKVYGRVFSLIYRRRLKEMIERSQYDLILVDGNMAQYGLLVKGVRRILDEVDIYSTVAYHSFLQERRPLQRLQAIGEWLRTLHYELAYARRYDGIVTRSLKDRVFLQELLPGQPIGVLSPWFEGLTENLLTLPLRRPADNRLLFVGAMNNPKNIDAVTYFAQEIFPIIRQQISDAIFDIVGGNPVPEVELLALVDGVQVIGAVEDLTPYYANAAVNIVPLRIGGGIITKTLNGMASGRPTVSTSFGISGIHAKNGEHVIVADTPEEFADRVICLLEDVHYWSQIAQCGRRFVRENYDWNRIMAGFEQYMDSVFQRELHRR